MMKDFIYKRVDLAMPHSLTCSSINLQTSQTLSVALMDPKKINFAILASAGERKH